jgi:hypothetical protein
MSTGDVMAVVTVILYVLSYLMGPDRWHPYQLSVMPILVAIFLKIGEVKDEIKKARETDGFYNLKP